MKKIIFASSLIMAICASCTKNDSISFPDYKYTTVYFAYQYPVKTLILGNDIFDNTLDNQHVVQIQASMGGAYSNTKDISIGVSVDNTLANNLTFENGTNVVAMPASYYSLSKDMKISIPAGSVMGGMNVQLTDAFFADPKAIKNTYVIPLRMNSVIGADSILSGKSTLTSPDPRVVGNWVTVPKNYILYAVKYMNPWHGNYLRRGIDVVKGNNGNTSLDTTVVYHTPFVETDQVVSTGTLSMAMDSLMLAAKTKNNAPDLPFQMLLTFDGNGKCTITGASSTTYSLTGNGEFVKGGDSWGNTPRDVLHLKYTVAFGTTTHSFTDTLVMRDRGVKFETFNPTVH